MGRPGQKFRHLRVRCPVAEHKLPVRFTKWPEYQTLCLYDLCPFVIHILSSCRSLHAKGRHTPLSEHARLSSVPCHIQLDLDIQQITENLQRAVCLMSQHLLGQHLSKLHAFLVKAVYIPHKSLEHHFILKV